MKRNVFLWELFGFAITSFLGTLLHFLYDFTGNALWAAPISGVNESTFEHMKLLFWPMLLYALFQGFFFKDYKCYPSVTLRGISVGLILIPTLFYTYSGIIGKTSDVVNISIFFISAAIAYIYMYFKLSRRNTDFGSKLIPSIMIFIIAASFVIFTFYPPKLGIFMDPVTLSYGI